MKRYVPFFILIIVIFVACSTAYRNLQPTLPDISTKQDGVYRGEYEVEKTPVKVVLDVFLQNSIIHRIDIIEHTGSPIGKKAEKITDVIISNQSLDAKYAELRRGKSKI